MQINMDDISFVGEKLAKDLMSELATNEIKANKKFNQEAIINTRKKFSWDNILNTEYGIDVVQQIITGCIYEYHEQLREKLLEQSIDIGEIDINSIGKHRSKTLNVNDETV